jgi:hypothetical protein
MTVYIIDSIEKRREAAAAVNELTSDKVMQVEIKPSTRSLRQNAAYWGVWLRAIEDATDIQAKAWHEFFKREFIPISVYEVEGKLIEVTETTTDLTTKEFSEYSDHIHKYCAERLNITLPELE